MTLLPTSFRPLLGAIALASASSGCLHTPPGTPVATLRAKRAELVSMPPNLVTGAPVEQSAVEPKLPSDAPMPNPTQDTSVRVADAFSRGTFCMETGKPEEAIAAFQETVQLDPNHGPAWSRLASLYEQKGEKDRAVAAFKRAKSLPQ